MPTAKDARDWAASGALLGLGDSLYTPFSGPDGDDIDYDAYRWLVRYCAVDLQRDLLWITSGIGEWWALTVDERKKLVEVTVDEVRAAAPDTVVEACTCATSAKDTVELTQHAASVGADICYIQTPPMEVHGGEGVLRFFQYVADRTDIALGMFNSDSSGYVLTPQEAARIYEEIPAVVAVKEGVIDSYVGTPTLHALAPGLQIWETDEIVYQAGWQLDGRTIKAQLGSAGYLNETPDNPRYRTYYQMLFDGHIAEAKEYAKTSGLTQVRSYTGGWLTKYPGRPDYFTHWGGAFKYAASVIGLPVGDHPDSRPPQVALPEHAKTEMRANYERIGMADVIHPQLART